MFAFFIFPLPVLVPRSRPPFPFPPFPVPRSPCLVPRYPFPVPRSPFPVLRFPFLFSVSRSSFLVPYSLFLVLVKSLRSFRKSECYSYYCVVVFFVLLYQHLSVMEDMLKDFMLGEHLLLVGNQVE